MEILKKIILVMVLIIILSNISYAISKEEFKSNLIKILRDIIENPTNVVLDQNEITAVINIYQTDFKTAPADSTEFTITDTNTATTYDTMITYKLPLVLLGDSYGSFSNPGTSCNDLIQKVGKEGLYWLDNDGDGATISFQVYCGILNAVNDGSLSGWRIISSSCLKSIKVDGYSGEGVGTEVIKDCGRNHDHHHGIIRYYNKYSFEAGKTHRARVKVKADPGVKVHISVHTREKWGGPGERGYASVVGDGTWKELVTSKFTRQQNNWWIHARLSIDSNTIGASAVWDDYIIYEVI